MRMRQTKTPMQLRREQENRQHPPSPAPGPVSPQSLPMLTTEDDADATQDAASAWLAHLAAGRIAVR